MKIFLTVQLFIFSIFTGCIIPESNHVEPNYHLLTSLSEDENESLHVPGLSFYVREVSIPPYLDDNRLARRHHASTLTYEESHRWGEPLGEGISRIVGLNLSTKFGILSYSSYPNRAKGASTYEISISILQFEKFDRDMVHVVAVIDIFHRSILQSQFKINEFIPIQGKGVVEETKALSAGLDRIAGAIATRVFALPLSQCMLLEMKDVNYDNALLDQIVKELSFHFLSNVKGGQKKDEIIRLEPGLDLQSMPKLSISLRNVTLLDVIKQIQRKTNTALKISSSEITFVPFP